MDRTYLYVDPEEGAEVRAHGAKWDEKNKLWYVEGEPASVFARWLPGSADSEYTIGSDRAFVASTVIPCPHCGTDTEVIGIHCREGIVMEGPLERFTVSEIYDMDPSTLEQLKPWPNFRRSSSEDPKSEFANHCAGCGGILRDLELHSEPGQPFFDIASAAEASVTLIPLTGWIRLSGNDHFIVD